MVSIIKMTCIVIIYYTLVSVCNLDKVTETTSKLTNQVKEYVVDSCSSIVPHPTKMILLFKSDIRDYLPFKK